MRIIGRFRCIRPRIFDFFWHLVVVLVSLFMVLGNETVWVNSKCFGALSIVYAILSGSPNCAHPMAGPAVLSFSLIPDCTGADPYFFGISSRYFVYRYLVRYI